jgi:hypothetical protein
MTYQQGTNTTEGVTHGLPPVLSLSAVTTGTGLAIDGQVVRNIVVMTVTGSTGVTAGAVQLQISNDNVNWANEGSPVTVTASDTTNNVNTGVYARFARAVVSTTVTGGTVTVSVGVSD